MSAGDRILGEDGERVVAACWPELERLSGKTVVITGATGFIGGSIVDALLAFNAGTARPCRLLLPTRSLVRAGARRPDLRTCPQVRWLEWRDGGPLNESGEDCHMVVHAASPVEPAIFARDPVAGARDMIELTRAVVELAVRQRADSFLLLSSGAVYGRQSAALDAIPETYAGEPDPADPASAYGLAKRACEALCFGSGIRAVAARLFACIGPRQSLQSGFAVPDFFRQALAAGRIHLTSDGRALRTFCYVSDAVTALIKLLAGADGPHACNLGSEAPVVSIAEAAARIARRLGGIPVEAPRLPTSGIAPRYVPDISLMKRLHQPRVPLDEGIDRIASFLCAGAR